MCLLQINKGLFWVISKWMCDQIKSLRKCVNFLPFDFDLATWVYHHSSNRASLSEHLLELIELLLGTVGLDEDCTGDPLKGGCHRCFTIPWLEWHTSVISFSGDIELCPFQLESKLLGNGLSSDELTSYESLDYLINRCWSNTFSTCFWGDIWDQDNAVLIFSSWDPSWAFSLDLVLMNLCTRGGESWSCWHRNYFRDLFKSLHENSESIYFGGLLFFNYFFYLAKWRSNLGHLTTGEDTKRTFSTILITWISDRMTGLAFNRF